jgi:calcium/calmodulin-dependent protein kinase I
VIQQPSCSNTELFLVHLLTQSFFLSFVCLLVDSNGYHILYYILLNLTPHSQQSDTDDSNIKIADFGFAKKCHRPKSLTTQCGTPGYVAPEILEGTPYDTQADMWSLGVIVYILLGGYPPFIEQNQRELFRKIRKGQYEFHEEYWGQVSADAKNLISSLLTVSSTDRMDADEALTNKWITAGDDQLAQHDLGVNLDQFKKFNAKRKFRAAVNTVMVANKFVSLGLDFKKDLA